MPLPANSKLGPYEIKSTLGVGGMGEVYRARDSRLNRDVAIKVLRQDSTTGASADLRSRLEREARAVAALNHPNIVAVYDFGVEPSETGAQQYIVSELIEGESLRSLLHGKPLPVRKLIDIAAQVADGLAAAHAAGVVHRDLKPENIMLAKDGRVKILDFGLARQSRATTRKTATGEEETIAPPADETKHLTSEGAVLGTASYMSPEQALGKEVDYRSDQFSFGLILHEMASGKQAFARNSSIETMAAIVRDEPSAIEEKIPAPLKWIIDRCLHKEPEQRYESTRDLYRDLKSLREHFSEAYTSERLAPVAAIPVKSPRWKVPAICAACISLTALLVYVLKPSGQDIGNYRYTPLASGATEATWAPDGNAVAYRGKVNGIYQLFLRHLNSPAPVQLTREKHSVYTGGWSSDKNHIIFAEWADDPQLPIYNIYSVATVGGEPELIMKIECYWAWDVSRDGRTLAARIKDKDGYFRIAVSDPLGSPLKIYSPDPFASKADFGGPGLTFAPDGKKMLYSFSSDKGIRENWLLPYPAGSGRPQLVLQKLPPSAGSLSWMPDSRYLLVSIPAEANAPGHLAIANISSGVISPLTTGTADEDEAMASPDGKNILYTQLNDQEDVISVSLVDGTTTTLVSTGHTEAVAAWSATQAKLVWATNRNGPFQIWMRTPDGSERPVVTAADFPEGGATGLASPSLSPDGERLIYDRTGADSVLRLWISSLSGGAPVRLTNVEPGGEFGSTWSPDGSRFVYLQAQGGKTSVMITKTSGNAAPVLLKEGVLFCLPAWSPTGDWISYRDQKGWSLISPDGKRSKFLAKIQSDYLAFSRDGKLLYGIQMGETEADRDRATLFSLDPVSLKQTTIKELGKDFIPARDFTVRFGLNPDGKSFVYSVDRGRTELWMLQGYRQPGLWNQIKDAFHFSKPN